MILDDWRQVGEIVIEVVPGDLGGGCEDRLATALDSRGVKSERPQRCDHVSGP